MSLTKSIATNTILHTLGKFSGSFLGLIVVGLMTRYLGTQGYGFYTTILAYLFFFATVGDLGLYLVTINEMGREGVDQKKIFSNIFTMRFTSGVILMILANSLIWLFPYAMEIKLGTLAFSLAMFLMMVDQVTVAIFQTKMKTKYVAVAEIVGKILMLGLVILFIQLKLGFIAILWAIIISFAIHFLINILFARKLLAFKFAFDKNIWRSVMKKSWPVATYMIFSMIYFKADTIVLSLYHPQSVVGLYGAPYKILEVLISFPAIFMGLVSPHLSRAWSAKKIVDFKDIFQKAFDFLSIITWPLVFGTIILATPIMNLIAGQEFLASAGVLKILIVATGIIFLAHLSTFAVVAINKQKVMMKYYILAAILAMTLYFIFIPKYSFYAAATITVGIELFILIASWLMIRKTLRLAALAQGGFAISFKNNLKSFLAALIMAGILYLINFGLFVSVILGAIIYLAGIYLFGALKKDLILEFFNKNKEE